jgi:hypothetical protein
VFREKCLLMEPNEPHKSIWSLRYVSISFILEIRGAKVRIVL